jgi:hypothetical protein
MTTAPHPVTVNLPPDQLRQNFVHFTFTDIPDSLWSFGLVLPKSIRRATPQTAVPKPGGPMLSLALLNRPDPPCDIEIFGQHLLHELHPADCLDIWLEKQACTILSRKRVPTIAGDVGDIVVQWKVNDDVFLGRLFAIKTGPRLFVIWARTAESNYPALAEPIFLSLSSFHVLDATPGPLAEKVQWTAASLPIPWKIALPVSWKITEESATAAAASFQATLPSNPPSNMLAKISFAVIAPNQITDSAQAFEKMHAALHDAGVSTEPAAITPIHADAPYTQAWQSDTVATVNNLPAELRLRVQQHPKAWISALLLCPPKPFNPDIYLRATRLFDLCFATLELT